ncbi:PEP-CTERM sorting domain-containing protein [Thalassotalea aquiviva]|uniref:PEP-CTERM sorting domain-containing protein n=1 Tax=Thalassotalea aquiviva TaxID=3242415 RepID=UPI00352A70E3
MKLISKFTIACVFLLTATVNAALIEDDLFTTGDGFLIKDTTTNKEWLDVTQTVGLSVNEFFSTSPYATLGFNLANASEVYDFFFSAGAEVVINGNGFGYSSGNEDAAILLASLMEHEAPYTKTNGNRWVHGYIDIGSPTNLSLARFDASVTGEGSFAVNSNGTTWTKDTTNGSIGLWVYRQLSEPVNNVSVDTKNVPEPTGLILFILGLFGLMRSRKV